MANTGYTNQQTLEKLQQALKLLSNIHDFSCDNVWRKVQNHVLASEAHIDLAIEELKKELKVEEYLRDIECGNCEKKTSIYSRYDIPFGWFKIAGDFHGFDVYQEVYVCSKKCAVTYLEERGR